MKTLYHKIKTSIQKYNNILIYIKGSPDPDAIASSFVLKKICQKLDVESSIIATTMLSLQENKEFVKRLNIPIKFEKELTNINSFDAYAIVDHQSAYVEKVSGKIPCAIHIDHHDIIDEGIEIDSKIIELKAGSTSTIMSLILKDIDFTFNKSEMRNISTALLFGIKTDTDQLLHASEMDYNAIKFISAYTENVIIDDLTGLTFSKMSKTMLALANENQFIYKDWLITGIGYIDQRNRDIIAIVADYLLKKEKISTIIVFAAVFNNNNKLILDASFRTNNEGIDLNSIIKEITDQGGGRKYKGAFQINLDFFSHCPDKNLLWDVIRLTVIEVLIKRRDKIYVTEIKGFYHKFKHKISKIIKGK